jgi:hypothetical protein
MTTNARTDPQTGLRFYTWQGVDYPSVTSIRRLIGMPFTLHNWALSKVIDRAIVDHTTVGQMLERPKKPRERTKDANVLKEVRAYLRAAATEERDKAGDRGTQVHEAIANISPLNQVSPEVVGPLSQYYDFMQESGASILWAERQVFNLTHGYAGTGDALLLIPAGWPEPKYPERIVMTDYKSSKGVYIDHAVQLMAYTMAEFVGENDKVDAVATQQLHDVSGMAILHLSDTEWEWIEVRGERTLFAGFVASLVFARFLDANDNSIEPLIETRRKGGTLVPALARGLKLVGGTP